MPRFDSYDDLLAHVEERGHEYRVLGHAPDGRPVVSVRAGGGTGDPVFLTAGSHASEQAGVSAAVELLDALDTDRPVHVIPSRDPMGMSGYAHALGTALGESVAFDSFPDLEALLAERGELLHREDDFVLALVGEHCFATHRPPGDGGTSFGAIRDRLEAFAEEGSEVVAPLRGRRVFTPPGQTDVEHTGDFGQAYTLVVSPGGEVLHLNRFFDRAWAPVETRCVRRRMNEVDPALFVDLHEAGFVADRYWLSVRSKADPDDEAAERRVGRAMADAAADAGATLGGSGEHVSSMLEAPYFERVDTGVFHLDYETRGEGLNATDFAAKEHGLAFTSETGMHNDFERRVDLAVAAVQGAVDAFEEEA